MASPDYSHNPTTDDYWAEFEAGLAQWEAEWNARRARGTMTTTLGDLHSLKVKIYERIRQELRSAEGANTQKSAASHRAFAGGLEQALSFIMETKIS